MEIAALVPLLSAIKEGLVSAGEGELVSTMEEVLVTALERQLLHLHMQEWVPTPCKCIGIRGPT